MTTRSAQVKYIFLDIVAFTHKRSVEAQTEIIAALNNAVYRSLTEHKIEREDRILLPTGDGICIGLLHLDEPIDAPLSIAFGILAGISRHNNDASDESRRFEVRIGINENVDNVVTDINGVDNLAGAGINTAARIMNAADGNQILVGHSIHEVLSVREKYANAFARHTVNVKHGVELPIFQYIGDLCDVVNREIPSTILESVKAMPPITRQTFVYMLLCNRHRERFEEAQPFLAKAPGLVVTTWLLTTEICEAASVKGPKEKDRIEELITSSENFQKRNNLIETQDFNLTWEFAQMCFQRLIPYAKLFETDSGPFLLFLSDGGKKELAEMMDDVTDIDRTKFNLTAV